MTKNEQIIEYLDEHYPEYTPDGEPLTGEHDFLQAADAYARELWAEAEEAVTIGREFCGYCEQEKCHNCNICHSCEPHEVRVSGVQG